MEFRSRLFFTLFTVAALARLAFSAPTAAPVTMPLFFEANQGQSSSDVRFIGRSKHGSVLLTDAGITFLSGNGSVQMRLLGTQQDLSWQAIEALPGRSNYLVGDDPNHWISNVPQYAKV